MDKPIKDKENTHVEEYERIFERYLDVCNQALKKNKDRFPYKEIWAARVKTLGSDNTLQCAVYDDRPKIIYTLRLSEDMEIKIIKKEPVEQGDVWPLKYSYMKQVVDNPHEYIEHPANLDWGWLTGVFG
ncbi:MAG: hypothetical protein WC521_07475 [Bdellovibrionales bacterium]